MNICLVVGHRRSAQGAENPTIGVTEFEFNNELAMHISSGCRHNCFIVHRHDDKSGYGSLPYKINSLDFDLVISLHCNAFNGKAGGHEVLYWHTSSKSREWALRMNEAIGRTLNNNDRGIKPIKPGDRGANILRSTKAPCVLLEPIFIDNDNDYFNANIERLANGIIKELHKY